MNDIFKNRKTHILDQKTPRKNTTEKGWLRKTIDDTGFLHGTDDNPALILSSGCEYYYKHGFLHILSGAAIIEPSGDEKYYIEGNFIESKKEFIRITRLLKLQSLDIF
jgi:hypothetical protein